MFQMLKYFFLTIVILLCHHWQLKTANFEKKNHFTGQTNRQTDHYLKFLTYIDMTLVKFLVHRLLVGETQTDRQTRQICNRYIYLLQIYLDKTNL